jgi:hypothetical protein
MDFLGDFGKAGGGGPGIPFRSDGTRFRGWGNRDDHFNNKYQCGIEMPSLPDRHASRVRGTQRMQRSQHFGQTEKGSVQDGSEK